MRNIFKYTCIFSILAIATCTSIAMEKRRFHASTVPIDYNSSRKNIDISPNCKYLYDFDKNHLSLNDAQTGKFLWKKQTKYSFKAWSPQDNFLLLRKWYKKNDWLAMCNPKTGNILWEKKDNNARGLARFSPDEKSFVVGNKKYDTESGQFTLGSVDFSKL